jgi:carbonic anhydrase
MELNRRRALKAMAALAACPLCGSGVFAAEGAHWSYEGAEGPDHWGNLDAASKVCTTGSQQSPIDVDATIRAELPPLKIQWTKSADTIVNNGHTIQLNAATGSTLTLGDDEYKLVQFHFHRPSEHLIDGKRFPMEAHFVHQHSSGALAVVGVLMTAGAPNAAFNKVVATMPDKEGPAVKADPAIDPNGFLPGSLTYYRYNGSLTTPPCAETVAWLLLTQPLEVAEADVAGFAKLYAMNARPVQKDNRRFVLRSG